MSILRLSIFAALLIALIPTSPGNQYSFYRIITTTAHDMGEFCVRNPQTCDDTTRAFSSFKDKAAYISSVISSAYNGSDQTASTEREPKINSSKKADMEPRKHMNYEESDKEWSPSKRKTAWSNDTLKQEDLSIEWLPPETDKPTRISRL